MPGFASLNGLDIGREIFLYSSAVVLASAGGALALRLTGGPPAVADRPEPLEHPRAAAAAMVRAHALMLWMFVVSGFAGAPDWIRER